MYTSDRSIADDRLKKYKDAICETDEVICEESNKIIIKYYHREFKTYEKFITISIEVLSKNIPEYKEKIDYIKEYFKNQIKYIFKHDDESICMFKKEKFDITKILQYITENNTNIKFLEQFSKLFAYLRFFLLKLAVDISDKTNDISENKKEKESDNPSTEFRSEIAKGKKECLKLEVENILKLLQLYNENKKVLNEIQTSKKEELIRIEKEKCKSYEHWVLNSLYKNLALKENDLLCYYDIINNKQLLKACILLLENNFECCILNSMV